MNPRKIPATKIHVEQNLLLNLLFIRIIFEKLSPVARIPRLAVDPENFAKKLAFFLLHVKHLKSGIEIGALKYKMGLTKVWNQNLNSQIDHKVKVRFSIPGWKSSSVPRDCQVLSFSMISKVDWGILKSIDMKYFN